MSRPIGRLGARRLLQSLLILALYAPVLLSVGLAALGRAWAGVSYMVFVAVLMSAFVGLAWWFANEAFDDAPPVTEPEGEA